MIVLATEQVGPMSPVVYLVQTLGLPIALVIAMGFAIWKIIQKQDTRYDGLVTYCAELEKDFRAVLQNQIEESNRHMAEGNHLRSSIDEYMKDQYAQGERQSGLLEQLVARIDQRGQQ